MELVAVVLLLQLQQRLRVLLRCVVKMAVPLLEHVHVVDVRLQHDVVEPSSPGTRDQAIEGVKVVRKDQRLDA